MLSPGDTFDRYTIEGLLGEGGMGKVYQAYDPRLHRKVAVKVLNGPEKRDDDSLRAETASSGAARMLREARAAAALDHPNAVAIFDVGEVDGTPFIAMELIVGRSLRSLEALPTVPWDKRLRWLVDVARALGAAHKRGLVHRDIKPENVMVREDGVVKVLDFGIARRPDAPVDPEGATQQMGLEALTGKGVVIGTPRYMSPEQMRGDALDGRSDQFAWGVLAFEILTGKSPWRRSDDSLAAVAELLTREPEAMDVSGLPELVEHTVRRALAKTPEGRFSSMEDIVRALEPFASGSLADVSVTSQQPTVPTPPVRDTEMATASPTPEPERPPPALPMPPESPSRSRWGLVTVALIAAAVAAAAAWRHSPAPRPTPPVASASAAPNAAPTAVTDLPDPPTASPEALAAYRSAMQAFRDGVGGVDQRFKRATELDPNLAAAHLRLAHSVFQTSPSAGRAAYNKAVELRSALSPRDQAFLWALEPFIADQASDTGERTRRLRQVAETYPRDAELWYHIGLATADRFISEDLPSLERAVEIDPKFARAWWQLGQGHAYRGDFVEAREALGKCLEVSHAATSCLWNRICLDESDGRCDAVEADAKQWAAVDGKDPLGRFAVAAALYARGRSMEAVDESLRQKEAVEPDAERPKSALYDDVQRGFLRGDFASVLRAAHAMEELASSSQAETEHQPPARATLEALVESGRVDAAATFAATYLQRREAWLPEPFAEDFALANDVVPLMLGALRKAGKLTAAELQAQRAAWIDGWTHRLAPEARGYVWMHGRAALAQDPKDAADAFVALGDATIPRYTPKTLVGAHVGRTLLLAGRVDEAIPVLERATASCLALELPVVHTRAHLWLGNAREAKHDVAGACAAYAVVLARWGHAVPKSITADEARARSKALGCK